MREESKRIRAKEHDQSGLTPGQAETLVRNDQGADKLEEEVDDLEEELCESVRETLLARRQTKEQSLAKVAVHRQQMLILLSAMILFSKLNNVFGII